MNKRRNAYHSTFVFISFFIFFIFFFSPVLFFNHLLAPGDGISYFLPAFYSARSLWTNLIFSGYPIAADPQNMTWYPPGLMLSLIPNSWNTFIVLAYALAGSFSYCYSYMVTRSKLAATVSGLVFSLSGFMISHLGHAAMIHAAAWMPLILCALEKLRHQFSRWWFAVGALAVACCFLGGHPQISVYGIGMGAFYAFFLGWKAPVGRWRYYRWATLCVVFGLGLCSLQILPTVELSQLSVRANMPFDQFITYSLPAWQALQLLFPYLFGGGAYPFNTPYWGEWNIVEIAGYVGFLPIVLAVIGLIKDSNRAIAKYWFAVALITLLLSFGGETFLGHILYHVPVYNKFRAQGRHFIEMSMAISILAGLGVNAIQQHKISKRFAAKILVVTAGIILAGLCSVYLFQDYFEFKARQLNVSQLNLLPWNNAAVFIPVIIFCLVLLALMYFCLRRSRWSIFALLFVLVVDLSSFGFFQQWRFSAPSKTQLEPTELIHTYRNRLDRYHQRFLNPDVISQFVPNGVYPNLTRLWKLPNASGYSPLLISRLADVMPMYQNGALPKLPIEPSERQIDLMAIRYMLASLPDSTESEGLTWAKSDFGLTFGTGVCSEPRSKSEHTLDFKKDDYKATTIGLVTSMGCAVGIPDGTAILQLHVTDSEGNVEVHDFKAGNDTAEQAYDCQDVLPLMQHQRAHVFSSTQVFRPDGSHCLSHDYVSKIQLSRPQKIEKLEFYWNDLPAVMSVKKLSLSNNIDASSSPVTQLKLSKIWKEVGRIDTGIIYENQRARPRAWLVSKTVPLTPKEILQAIHTSRLPNGQIFKPQEIALVEDVAAEFQSSNLNYTDSAEILTLQNTRVDVKTNASTSTFLVLSDIFYPGWQASIDGKPTRIFQTNYIQRGVKVPVGEHIVRFEFKPLSFRVGLAITIMSLLGGGYWLVRRKEHTPSVVLRK